MDFDQDVAALIATYLQDATLKVEMIELAQIAHFGDMFQDVKVATNNYRGHLLAVGRRAQGCDCRIHGIRQVEFGLQSESVKALVRCHPYEEGGLENGRS